MEKRIVVDIPFNINLSIYQTPGSYIEYVYKNSFIMAQTKEWVSRRLELAMKYAINCLIHQTNPNFIGLLRCTKETKGMIEEELRKYPKLPDHILFVTHEEAEAIMKAQIKAHHVLYRAVLDSDNMYCNEIIDLFEQYEPREMTRSIVCQAGYLYCENYQLLASMIHPMPPFYAAIYDQDSFGSLYKKRLFEDHFKAAQYPYEVLPGKNYLVSVHEQNLSNQFVDIFNTYQGELLSREEEKSLLQTWHLA